MSYVLIRTYVKQRSTRVKQRSTRIHVNLYALYDMQSLCIRVTTASKVKPFKIDKKTYLA